MTQTLVDGIGFRGDWEVSCYKPIEISAQIVKELTVSGDNHNIVYRDGQPHLPYSYCEKHYPNLCQNQEPAWKENIHNLVVDEGINAMLDYIFNSSAYTSAFYVGLLAASPVPAAGDGLSDITEFTGYDEANRQTYTSAAAASKAVTNSANKAVFTITSDSQSIGGAFLATVNSGTGGTLISQKAFPLGNKAADSGDTLHVTITYTGSSS